MLSFLLFLSIDWYHSFNSILRIIIKIVKIEIRNNGIYDMKQKLDLDVLRCENSDEIQPGTKPRALRIQKFDNSFKSVQILTKFL